MADKLPATFTSGKVSKRFKSVDTTSKMAAGIAASYAVISYRGKVWRVKHRGEETTLMRADGDGPRASLDIVVIDAAPVLSKIYYKKKWTEGSDEAPDCFSLDGVKPDPSAPNKQSKTCAGCPKNAWGSARSETTGKPIKACSDSKRVAVVPASDLYNETFGGPMLLRIPPTSLAPMAAMAKQMEQQGFPDGSYVIRISFDTDEAYPKMKFKAVRPVTDEEADVILELREDETTKRILSDASALLAAGDEVDDAEEPDEADEEIVDDDDDGEAPPPRRKPAKKPARKKPAPEPEDDDDGEDDGEEEPPKKPAKKPVRKKPAPEPEEDDGDEDEVAEAKPSRKKPPVKKPPAKKPARKKPAPEPEEDDGDEDGDEDGVEESDDYLSTIEDAIADFDGDEEDADEDDGEEDDD